MRLQLVCELDEPIARPRAGFRRTGCWRRSRSPRRGPSRRDSGSIVLACPAAPRSRAAGARHGSGGRGHRRRRASCRRRRPQTATLSTPERQAYRLDVLAVLGRRVVGPGGDRAPARRDRRRAGAGERAGLAGAAVVVGDERVPGEESPPVRGLQAEVERLRGGLARAAREHDHHAARLADRRELLYVERHLTRGGGPRSRAGRSASRRRGRCRRRRQTAPARPRPAPRPAQRALRRGGCRRFIGSQGSGAFAQPPREYTRTSGTARFRLSSWTGRNCIRSPRRALADDERLAAFADALPTPGARLRAGAAAAARRAPRGARPRARRAAARGRRRARRRRGGRAGSSARSGSRCSRAAASAGTRASSRRRTSSASGRARSTCSPAAGSSARRRSRSPSRLPPPAARPEPIDARRGRRARASRRSPSSSRSPGYERVERVEERGQFAVRGGLVDVFPTTGREPLRIELFGDEIEAIRAFSPFTQRALREVERRDDLPGGRAAPRPRSSRLSGRGRGAPGRSPTTSCRRSTGLPTSSASRTRCARSGTRSKLEPVPLDGRGPARPVPARASRSRSRRSGRRSPRAGSPRPRTSWPAFVRAGHASSSPSRTAARRCAPPDLLRRVEAELARARAAELPDEPELCFAVSPARRGFVWRDLGLALLPDTQVFRKRAPRARRPARPRAPVVRRPPHRRLRRPRGPRRRQAARLRDEGGRRRHARLPAASASAATTASTSRTSRSARSRATSAPTRRRPRSRSSAARRGSCSRPAPASPCASWPASCSRSTRAARRTPGVAVRPLERLARAARGGVPLPRDRGPGARDRGGEGGPRGAAADGPARLRRRRLRQDRGRGARRVRRRGQRQAGADARPDDDPRRSSTGTPSASASATSRCGSRWSRASASRPR